MRDVLPAAGVHCTWRTGAGSVPSTHTRCRTCSAERGGAAHTLPRRTGA